jgi:hypothetical protein
MTVESYRASGVSQGASFLDLAFLWALADFVSGSSSWEIIDSWASTDYQVPATENDIYGRYKGDPIADAQWADWDDIGQGAGIVIQQSNPRNGYPAMQIVVQVAGNSTLGYISGHTYRCDYFVTADTSYNATSFRIGTQGDWDLDDTRPDFANTDKSSDTYKNSFGHQGSGDDVRVFLSADDDWIVPALLNDTDKYFLSVWWFGQYNAKTAEQDPVDKPAYAMMTTHTLGGSWFTPTSNTSGSLVQEVPSDDRYIVALDENGIFQEWTVAVNTGLYSFISGSTQPNVFDADIGIDVFEILVRGRSLYDGYDNRLIGTLNGVYAAMRLGRAAGFDGDGYLCLGEGYGVVVEWDGTTIV